MTNEDLTLNGETLSESLLHSIIDELHSSYTPVTDEELVEDYEDHGVFERSFSHESGTVSKIRWSVYYGSPETVVTVFESIQTTDK